MGVRQGGGGRGLTGLPVWITSVLTLKEGCGKTKTLRRKPKAEYVDWLDLLVPVPVITGTI